MASWLVLHTFNGLHQYRKLCTLWVDRDGKLLNGKGTSVSRNHRLSRSSAFIETNSKYDPWPEGAWYSVRKASFGSQGSNFFAENRREVFLAKMIFSEIIAPDDNYTREMWPKVKVKTLMTNTRMPIVLRKCIFAGKVCTFKWKFVGTLYGQCLQFNAASMPNTFCARDR